MPRGQAGQGLVAVPTSQDGNLHNLEGFRQGAQKGFASAVWGEMTPILKGPTQQTFGARL